MNEIKNILRSAILIALLAVGLSVKADLTMVVPYNTYTNLLSTNGVVINSFTIANGTGTNTYVQFNDSAITNLYYTNLAYSTVVYTNNSAITNIYTNYFGVLTTNVYAGLQASSNYVTAVTNYNNIILAVAVPANTTTVISGLYRFIQGIQITNGLGQVTVTATLKQ